MTVADAVAHALSRYAQFSGRARRFEFWSFSAFCALLYFLAAIIDRVLRHQVVVVVVLLALATPWLATGARRMHDTGRSGWWQLVGLIPFFGALQLAFWYADDSDADNDHGPSPKAQVTGAV